MGWFWNTASAKRHFGWKRQPHDPRDKYLLFRETAALPSKFSLLDGMPPPIDQGALGSCGPNTADECVMFDQKAQGLPVEPASRLFVYYNTRALMGTVGQDSGVDNRTMMKALAQYGFCRESSWPYQIGQFKTKPPAAAYAEAAANRITDYAAVVQSISQMKAAIFNRKPFVFGFECFQQIESSQAEETGVLTTPRPGETPVGGHDVSMFGWDDELQVFQFRNHWRRSDGSPWGSQGNGTIPYAYAAAASLAGDFWAINTVPGSAPTPPPPPPPPPPPSGVPLGTFSGNVAPGTYQLVRLP